MTNKGIMNKAKEEFYTKLQTQPSNIQQLCKTKRNARFLKRNLHKHILVIVSQNDKKIKCNIV